MRSGISAIHFLDALLFEARIIGGVLVGKRGDGKREILSLASFEEIIPPPDIDLVAMRSALPGHLAASSAC